MNKKLLIVALLPLFIFSACTKETTETRTTTVTKPYVGPALQFWGTWQLINEDPADVSQVYHVLNPVTSGGASLYQDEFGLKELYYATVVGDESIIKFGGSQFRPYEISGDTMKVYADNRPGVVEETLLKVADNTVDPDAWIKKMIISKTSSLPSSGYSYNTGGSFGMDGNDLYIHANSSSSGYHIFKYNTNSNTMVDSASSASGRESVYYRKSSDKIYSAQTWGAGTMKQRTGLAGAQSNLSSNSLSSVGAVSMNPTSGTVYAFANSTIYSGTEGGNFSSLFNSFTGSTPNSCVYYKSDQFLGVTNNSLVLFEISPSYKIIDQYLLSNGENLYSSISTNGSDIWVMSRDNSTNDYKYHKVTLP